MLKLFISPFFLEFLFNNNLTKIIKNTTFSSTCQFYRLMGGIHFSVILNSFQKCRGVPLWAPW